MSLRAGLLRATRLSHPTRFPPLLFVRAAHDAYSATRLEHFLQPLRYPDEPNAVRRHYLPLISEIERIKANPSAPPLPPLLTREQLITIIDLLATSGRPPDLECIRSMFSHLSLHFGVPVTPELHTVVLSALLKQGYSPLAQDWLRRMPDLPPHVGPTLDHFHTYLKGCPSYLPFMHLRHVVINKTRRAGVRPTNETFDILVRSVLRNATHAKTVLNVESLAMILADIRDTGLNADPSILSMMTEYYMENGFQTSVVDIRRIYNTHFPDIASPEEEQLHEWRTRLTEASNNSGVEAGIDLFRRLGCPASPEMFRSILGSTRAIEDLRKVENALGIRAGVSEYSLLVNNNVRTRKVKEALVIYEQVKPAGIAPVAGLVGPIIMSLCSSSQKTAQDHNADVDRALGLYSDLDEAYPVSDTPEAPLNPANEHSKGPDVNIYTSLFRGLSLSSNIETAYPIAASLTEDMKARNISPTTAIKISRVILDMRNCDNLDDAFTFYRKRRADLPEHGYLAVLHAFSRMSMSLGHPDALDHYFQIVADMRMAGFRISARIFSDILQQFAEIAGFRKEGWKKSKIYNRNPSTPPPPKIFIDLNEGVKQIHDLMSLDTSIGPDNFVWNQLMDTYQRIGNFPEAYRTWETLFLSGKYGPIAVSIILDACGYAGDLAMAKQIVNQLMQDSYVLNLHNWETYIECLCRLNQIDAALRVVCTDMGTPRQPVKPELSTTSIMLKTAQSRMQTNIIMQRLRQSLPELYAQIQDAPR
ncbi:hypothetical protein FB45DRAFT_558271 [Roridomyces roridus]|uniref:Pentatricopeptide repeat-containing protein n=1 Tax=Roridomyces roridus TaxID=1738132 RepID=A0AAD7BV49_9AGAR|nr:hypothetical protein FB45DRAFT_558271 [Roridomyces roridus]